MSDFWSGIGLTPKNIPFYVIAVLSSLGVELLALIREISANNGHLPVRYKGWAFPVGRILFALIAAGPLAIVLDAQSKVAAFYIGISAPLIFDRLAAGVTERLGVDANTTLTGSNSGPPAPES
jgi:hypothetical protein